jgi:poly(3-hydroxybutyrate) depolymerase
VIPDVDEGDGPRPLVFVFHGGTGEAAGEVSRLDVTAQFPDAVVLAPSARDKLIPLGVWEDGTASVDENPDLALFDNLLSCAERDLDVNPSRIYATGESAGAFFSGFLAKTRGDVLAAVAMFSGIMRHGVDEEDTPMLITYGGDDDRTLALDENGVPSLSFDYTGKSREQVPALRAAGHVVVACNTGEGHGPPEDAGPLLVGPFLGAHVKGEPSPFAGDGAPPLPSTCSATDVP